MTALDALQDCLAAEHAAVYGYGVLGGVVAGEAAGSAAQELGATAYRAHRDRRDALVETVREQGGDPVPAQAAYALPFEVADLADCRRLARTIEHRTAAVYAAAVAATVGDLRETAARGLVDAALREAAWGAGPDAFPGVDEP
jgi:hypothetical protein